MKSNMLSLAMATAGLSALPSIGHAQAIDGAFVNGNLGSASLDLGLIDDNDTSYGVNAGYRWAVSSDALIGIEVGYVDLGKYTFPASFTSLAPIDTQPTGSTIHTGSGSTEVSGWTIGASGRFNPALNWYIGGRVGFIGASVDSRVRITMADGSVFQDDIDDNANGWYAGAGFGYDFSNNFSLGLSYDYYNAENIGFKIDPGVVSVSGEYRF